MIPTRSDRLDSAKTWPPFAVLSAGAVPPVSAA